MVIILFPQSCVTLASLSVGLPSNMEKLESTIIFCRTIYVVMYGIPWMYILRFLINLVGLVVLFIHWLSIIYDLLAFSHCHMYFFKSVTILINYSRYFLKFTWFYRFWKAWHPNPTSCPFSNWRSRYIWWPRLTTCIYYMVSTIYLFNFSLTSQFAIDLFFFSFQSLNI